MAKILIGILYLIGLIALIVGIVLIVQSIPGGTTTVNSLGGKTTIPGNIPLFVTGLIITIVSAIPLTASWVITLVRLFPLQRWTWFILVLVLSIVAIPVYVFIGPETPAPSVLQNPGNVVPPSAYSSRN